MTAAGVSVPGISVSTQISLDIEWTDLGEWLGEIGSNHQRDLLGAFVASLQNDRMATAVLAERILLQEKDNPDMRATREAVQRFCRELLAHLDEGSR